MICDSTAIEHFERRNNVQKHVETLPLVLQEGFAPPDDEDVDEGAQGDQEEF